MSDLDATTQGTAREGESYRPQSRDADAVFERVLFERWRTMDAVEKAELINSMARDAAELTRAGVRMRHPSADDQEIEMRSIALRLGRELMVRAYGWDPDVEGW
jgi:hypothetical protein